MQRVKMALRAVILRLARRLGAPVVDQRTGRTLGRALVLTIGGRVHVIGLDAIVQPVFLPQPRLTFWKQELGFTTHPAPDFPHEPRA